VFSKLKSWEVGHSSSGTEDIACLYRGVEPRSSGCALCGPCHRADGVEDFVGPQPFTPGQRGHEWA
jgi:hypothetical protein